MAGLVLIAVIAFAIDIYISRQTYATIYACLDEIEIGDSSAEVVEKMKPFKKSPDKIFENDSIYYEGSYHSVTSYFYYTRWDASEHIYFFFPTGQDTLFHLYYD